ncbi:ROK family protein [Saccharibacillus sp. CPCC 101409]|uniref:ROK family protein n=1 Tax=Saccharibacillus sp. CPCC 101409 TaxID=3058041 RepID=UPI0026741EED|nr:ROK family protein [Saccharibacillus sp. CPCC 101409]MDO3413278.1 ROK family protein [Saccharibacillus sp. CPCC 101409]
MGRADTGLMKEINLNAVRRAMRRLETATKPQLSAETGLSVVTIAALVRELAERGELTEEALAPSTGGRPASVYRFEYAYSLALVLHLHEREGRDTVFASVVDLRGDSLLREQKPFDALNTESLLRWIGRLLERFPAVRVLALGIPGQTVDGRITVSSHERLRDVNPAALLEERFGLPVLVENDVNAAVRGYEAGLRREDEPEEGRLVLGIYFPEKYPPGMGISLDGRIVPGRSGMAGEIKFLPLDVDWAAPPQGEELLQVIARLVRILTAVLAPDRIVLYRDRGEEAEAPAGWARIWAEELESSELPAAPEIYWSRNFSDDFSHGLTALALGALERLLHHTDTRKGLNVWQPGF